MRSNRLVEASLAAALKPREWKIKMARTSADAKPQRSVLGAPQPDAPAQSGYVIGVDASNLLRGGGRNHLIELLRAAEPEAYGVRQIVVWAGQAVLAALPDRPWLCPVASPALDGGRLRRAIWQRFSLNRAAQDAGCDLLLAPGGVAASASIPTVVMCQNLLPFEWRELARYGCSPMTLRLLLLRVVQARSFRRATGVVFLTEHARRQIAQTVGALRGNSAVIPHGVAMRFSQRPRPQESIHAFSAERPYRVLYVSIVDQYKHPWNLVEAVAQVREQEGWSIALELIGPAYGPALRRLRSCLRRFDEEGNWTQYHGAISHDILHDRYRQADLAVFASSCENLPLILLESMASGLPVVSSDRGPMPEVLQCAGRYFDPEQPKSIAEALRNVIAAPDVRARMAAESHARAQGYTWKACAAATLQFLVQTVDSSVPRTTRAGT